MNRRHLHRCLLWLLPLLVLRAAVPSGFMLSVGEAGQLQFVLCSSGVPIAAPGSSTTEARGEHQARTHHSTIDQGVAPSDHGGEHVAHERSVCPYAVAGTTHAGGVPHLLVDAPAVAAAIVDFPADPSLNSVPVLIDRIRGPPLV